MSIVDSVSGNAVITLSSNGKWSAIDFEDNGTFKWGMGKDQFSNFYINDAFSGTERVKIDYQNEDIYLRGNVTVDDYNSSGAIVSAGKYVMRTGATNGYIPVSDANGEMTWTNPDSIITGSTSSSWYKANSTLSPNNINDDVYTNGKVGINTDNPTYDLEINGNIGFTSWDNTADSVGIYFNSNSDNAQIRYVSRDDNIGNTFLEISTGDNGDEPIIFSQGAQHYGNNGNVINSTNQERMRIHSNGYVGIGTKSPTNELDVDGKIRMRDGATQGYIPVSDANGEMTWTNPLSITTLIGATGPTGATGQNGQDGADGTNGIDGQDGATGPTGATGATGQNGQDGADGTNGIDGQDGATGPTGATGATGQNGQDGADGTNGIDGQDGATGPTGYRCHWSKWSRWCGRNKRY